MCARVTAAANDVTRYVGIVHVRACVRACAAYMCFLCVLCVCVSVIMYFRACVQI